MTPWPKDFFDASMVRFILVGIINTLVGVSLMFFLYNVAGCSYWFSSSANYVVGSIISFFLNKFYTFKNRGRSLKQVLRFIINILVCYFLAYGIARPVAWLLLTGFGTGIRDNAAMILGLVFFTCLNYLGQRYFAFK